MRLKDKTAIITGSGTGIGKASAILFAKEGANIVICGRREEKLKEVEREIVKELGLKAEDSKKVLQFHAMSQIKMTLKYC